MGFETLPSDAVEEVKGGIISGVKQGMQDTWGSISNPAGWVSGRETTTVLFPGTREVARSACRRWARGAGIQGPAADITYRPICEEYLDDLGELPEGGEFGRNFDGGQCATVYLVTLTNTSTTAPFPPSAQAFATGPVTGVRIEPGINPGTIFCFVEANPDVNFRTGNEGENWGITSVQRWDGNPDNCGNTPDGYRPTAYIPDDGGGKEPIEIPGFPPFSIDIGPDGDIVFDFPGFGGGGGAIDDPFVPIDPSEYGPELPPAPPPGDRGNPDEPVDVEPGEDAEDEKPDEILVGIKVTLTAIAPKARVSYLGGKAFYSYAYSVMMGGDGGVERDNESAFAPVEAFYHAPENSNRYSVAFRNGFGGTVVAYWKPVEED